MKIAILSRNENLYSTIRLKEAARERGHEVAVIDFLKCYIANEQGSQGIFFEGRRLNSFDAVIPRIGPSRTFYGTAVVRQFEMMGVFCANESQAIVRSRDKLRTMQILSRWGIGIPKTIFAADPTNISHIISELGGTPIVIKLLQGTQGIGVVLAETKKTAKSVIEAFYGLKANMLIQEYIKESKGEDYRCFVIGGKVVGAIKRSSAKGEFRSNIHRGGIATMVKLDKEEKGAAEQAAKVLGLNIAGVDMVRSKRGPLIIEVNSSPGLEGIETATGINVAGKIIEFVENNAFCKKLPQDRVKV